MKSCCENKSSELEQLRTRQLGVLKTVLFINAAMFFVEMISGIFSRSSALTADSLDMFGDATVYAFSIYVISKGPLWKARAARFKAWIMIFFGAAVLTEAGFKFFTSIVPKAETMGTVSVLALGANLVCLYLLYSHRSDDINMKSTWICSRNDIVANVGVLLASAAVYFTLSNVPDVIVGSVIAILFLSSALGILKEASVSSSEAAG